jgi:acyl dehydratase
VNVLHYEDFPVGEVVEFGDRLVTADEIVAFAKDWDPQPFHLDAEAAKNSQIGELIASGWHSGAMLIRMMCDAYLLESASEGAPGVDEIRWLKPVRPGDRLRARRTTVSARPSRSRPQIGVIEFHHELSNQNGETVLTMRGPSFIRRREAAP